ncbi:MAG: cyclic nucleotide-binding domain-containing protein [Devosia sp.]|nr:cyclic nucleotide-binding domain-containing protein [Devosia sp.]
MINSLIKIFSELADPINLFGHFTYFLLIVSMLMRRMVWLRSLAVASGIAKIIYRAYFVIDPVSVLWETIFVLVNVGQLALMWYYEHHYRFADDERHFVESMGGGVERSAIRRLLSYAQFRRLPPGDVITIEGAPVADLTYIADGVVKVEHGGTIVAVCGPGDYIGEMSFLSGAPASATVTVVKPVHTVSFDQKRLRAAVDADPAVRRALESALNRNLAGKLARSNDTQAEPGLPLEATGA